VKHLQGEAIGKFAAECIPAGAVIETDALKAQFGV
jgi:hypothetical protein